MLIISKGAGRGCERQSLVSFLCFVIVCTSISLPALRSLSHIRFERFILFVMVSQCLCLTVFDCVLPFMFNLWSAMYPLILLLHYLCTVPVVCHHGHCQSVSLFDCI